MGNENHAPKTSGAVAGEMEPLPTEMGPPPEASGPGFRTMTQTTGRHPTTQQHTRGTKTTRRQHTNGAKAQTRTKIPTTARGQAREKVTMTNTASGVAETKDKSAGSQSLSMYIRYIDY